MHPLEYRFITDTEADQFERMPHNPPIYDATFTDDKFSEEWWETRSKLKKRLQIFGAEWTSENDTGEFMLSEGRGDSRWIYVTLTSAKLWRPEFIQTVADFLHHLPHDYRVGCFSEPPDDAILETPFIHLVISSTVVYGNAKRASPGPKGKLLWSEWNDSLTAFGFPKR